MAMSNTTRDWIVEQARRAEREKARSRAVARAAGEDFYDASRLETVKRSIIRMLERDDELAEGELRRRLGRKEKRELFDQAIALLAAEQIVSSREGEYNGRTFIYWSCVTAPVTHENSSSTVVTTRVTHDQPATVTDLDSRRSHDSAPEKLTCQQWFNNWITNLQNQGYTTTTSLAATDAGMAAGYSKGNIRQAASAHPHVHSLGRAGGTAQWSITPDGPARAPKPAPEWLDEWLDAQTGRTVLPSDARQAGLLAGHPWENVRKAAGQSPRIRSVPAHGESRNDRIWVFVDADQAGA
jgi:hypothetical protein